MLRNEAARAAWREATRMFRPEDLIFLDETGSHLGYMPTHDWAPRGQRAEVPAPRNQGENKTVVAALTLDGIGPLLRFDGAMTSDRFEGYVRHILGPTLRPGQIVLADNLRAHHTPGVRAATWCAFATITPTDATGWFRHWLLSPQLSPFMKGLLPNPTATNFLRH